MSSYKLNGASGKSGKDNPAFSEMADPDEAAVATLKLEKSDGISQISASDDKK